MEKENWQVKINSLDYKLLSNVYIYRFIGQTIQWLEIKSPDLIVHNEKYDYGSANNIQPTFSCPPDEAIGIAKGFIEYANSQGFKNGSETFVKGKLEATENHLKDMRKLLKLT